MRAVLPDKENRDIAVLGVKWADSANIAPSDKGGGVYKTNIPLCKSSSCTPYYSQGVGSLLLGW